MLRHRKIFIAHFLLVGGLLLFLAPANAQSQQPIEILEQQADYLFNDWLHFTVRFQSPEKIQEGFVFFQRPWDEQAWVYQGELGTDQSMQVAVTLTAENKPKPFTELTYWYRFSTDHGEIFESQSYTLYYADNRYGWQTLEKIPFTLHWYNGEVKFAEALLAAADLGGRRAKELLPLSDLEPVTIWVYDNSADVQLLADQAGFAWQAGHTDPAAGLILLSLPPGPQQSLEIQRQVPHEIAHLMLYQALGAEQYDRLPVWLIEGLASNAEIYSDPASPELLVLAEAGNTLLPFYSLCEAFPQDGSSARLAYAQAVSFVDYLFSRYGSAGLGILVDAYAQAGDCMNASVASFGKDLIGLESEWRISLSEETGPLAWLSGMPWSAILTSGIIAVLLFLAVRFLTRSKRPEHG
ncbi:MAG: peptidase MA family metallohydrolase [Chloroflexi bacterium]|nr:peptidase MA family metallohydrolase [Chloroflexota bacterium]